MDARHQVMATSLAISLVMLVGKITAYWLTGSAAILADAAESIVHVAATAFAAFSLWYASRPADANHPFGHGRISFFSAGFEGALILTASIAVISSGIYDLKMGPQVKDVEIGLAISSVLAVINLALGATLVMVGKRHNSLVVVSNGHHVLSDVYTTAAAIVGLLLVALTGQKMADPIAAILIGFLIMYSGLKMMRRAFAGLMDELDKGFRNRLNDAISDCLKQCDIHDLHDMRARQVDNQLWLQFHVRIDGSASVDQAHDAITAFEESLKQQFQDFEVHINSHIEPLDRSRHERDTQSPDIT